MRAFGYIPCTIERGGFSSERTFSIPIEKGEEVIIGCSDVSHLLDANKQPIIDGTQHIGGAVSGFVACLILRQVDAATVLVEVPSREIFTIPERLVIREKWTRELVSREESTC